MSRRVMILGALALLSRPLLGEDVLCVTDGKADDVDYPKSPKLSNADVRAQARKRDREEKRARKARQRERKTK